jgi:hypothetical protein
VSLEGETDKKLLLALAQKHEFLELVIAFPMLNAYGIGLEAFRDVPEYIRMEVVDYAKAALCYSLKPELRVARKFLDKIGLIHCDPGNRANQYRASYISYLYSFWQRENPNLPEYIPLGCFIAATLMGGNEVKIYNDLKPDCLLVIRGGFVREIEKHLSKMHKDFKPWTMKEYGYSIYYDDRVDEQENELQSVNAVE